MKTSSLRTLALALGLVLTLPIISLASTFKHIVIDGAFDDWAGVPALYEDPSDTTAGTDLKTISLAHDEQYFYVRFTLYAPGDPFTARNNVFIDADNDPGTGFPPAGRGLGSELLIQSGIGFQEKNGGFNEGAINGLDWASAPAGAEAEFEFRISRNATFASDNSPVFAGDTIAILLEAENAQFTTVDTAPDDVGIVYTFTAAPAPLTANLVLVSLTGASWRINDSGADLGSAWREIAYDDSQAGWASGTGLFGFAGNAAAYPAPIQTPLATGRTTYYLRTQFQWTNDAARAVFVASNYLSDGAVFYLNGAEVKRLRVPSGPVTFNIPATGGPAAKGQAELAGFSATPLVIGTNLLAVETHQTSGDTADLVFGMSLLAAAQFPVTITDSSLPADRPVVAGQSTTFAAEFVATPPLSFQWLKNGNPIPNATNAALTIEPVLQADAGNYSVRISNPLASNVTSRAAVLTVTGVPVQITDASQPADQTVTEGEPVTFTVAATGSAPLNYQWFKEGSPLADATNAVYSIPSALLGDVGFYHATISNPLPSMAASRRARLTVNRDLTPPTMERVAGTPNKVIITFSELVTEASASMTANYSISGGVTVNSAAWNAESPETVVLATGAQTLGALYSLTVRNVSDRFANSIAPGAQATFRSTIVIDGSFADWAAVPLAFEDPQDTTESTDYKDVYITNDADFLYLRVTLHTPSDLAIFYNNIFIDSDNDPATGYAFRVGSEMLIQGGGGYQQKNGAFNEGEVSGLDWAIAPEGVNVDFEFRISRKASYVSDKLPVFTADTIAIVLESENTSFQTRETAPDVDSLIYTFQAAPPADLGPLAVLFQAGQTTISWSPEITDAVLESTERLPATMWTPVTGVQNNSVTISSNVGTRFFRLRK